MEGKTHKPYLWCRSPGRVRLKAGFYGTLCIKLESFKVKLTFEYIGQGKRNSILNLGYWNK